ncbi:MAG: tRNA 2-thiouridine(34) synthase MnmA [Oscillospiraceae bacterium]|nr:tRNA 2-thiouridine(34) synthase MnmA [Oscillospiraceae bacterium]
MMAMSGGVDSSTTAALLCESGYDVTGVTLKLYARPGQAENPDIAIARGIAKQLGIPHHLLDLQTEFAEHVIKRFIGDYRNGKTPNPCVYCNRHIKFGALLNFAESLGCDKLATGHYATVDYDPASKRYLLKKAADKHKDQSYVLYSLNQRQLSKVLFPMGSKIKTAVRELAKEKGLPNHQKPESQDICFVKGMSYSEFIKDYSGDTAIPGDFVDNEGNKLGTHEGIINYTIGQRKGLGIAFGEPKYVVAKLAEKNKVVIGEERDLYSNKLTAEAVNFIPFDTLTAPLKTTAKVRYNQEPAPATIHPLEGNKVHVEFTAPQRAITPGQHVVFYDGNIVVGGGMIL